MPTNASLAEVETTIGATNALTGAKGVMVCTIGRHLSWTGPLAQMFTILDPDFLRFCVVIYSNYLFYIRLGTDFPEDVALPT